jgi:hypothetical protein
MIWFIADIDHNLGNRDPSMNVENDDEEDDGDEM